MRFRLEHATEAAGAASRIADPAEEMVEGFTAALASDLNISAALAALFGFVKTVNVAIEEGGLVDGDKERVLAALDRVDGVLGVLDPAAWGSTEESADDDIQRLVDERQRARAERDFDTADRLRGELDGLGIVIEDTPDGTRWRRQ